MPSVPIEAILATSFDDRFPASAITEEGNACFMTTGMYPHEVLLKVGSSDGGATIEKLILQCNGVKAARIDVCTDKRATTFEPLCDITLDEKEAGAQEEHVKVSAAGVRFMKLVLLQGHDAFSAVRRLTLEGRED